MRGPFLFPALAGQAVVTVRVCEPWGGALPPTDGPASLFGAIILQCGRHSLLCYSPVRYLSNPQGSRIGLHGGEVAALPFRASLCEVDDLEHWLPLTGGAHWSHCVSPVLPMSGEVMAEAPQMVRDSESGPWQLEFRFCTGRSFRLQYRTDLDASLQFAPVGCQHVIDHIVVSSPDAPFGWLHPAYPHQFVLGDSCWRSAQVSDWPWPLRKALQSHNDPETFYLETMRRALTARFRQSPLLRQRLLALSYPLQVSDVPGGLYAALAQNLHQGDALSEWR